MEGKGIFVFLGLLAFGACAKKIVQPTRTTAAYQLALTELQRHNDEEQGCKRALALLEQVDVRSVENPLEEGLKATCLLKLKKFQDAEASFKKALQLSDSALLRSELENNYACLLASQGRFVEAQALWAALCESKDYLTPEVALVNQAKVFVSLGRMEEAKALLVRATDKAPRFVDAWQHLWFVATRLNDEATAHRSSAQIQLLEEAASIAV